MSFPSAGFAHVRSPLVAHAKSAKRSGHLSGQGRIALLSGTGHTRTAKETTHFVRSITVGRFDQRLFDQNGNRKQPSGWRIVFRMATAGIAQSVERNHIRLLAYDGQSIRSQPIQISNFLGDWLETVVPEKDISNQSIERENFFKTFSSLFSTHLVAL